MIYIYYILHIIYIYLSPYPSFGDTRARARGVTLGGGGFLSKLPQAPIKYIWDIIYIYIMRWGCFAPLGSRRFVRFSPNRASAHFSIGKILFYVNGVKVIPDNIYELLTPIALAHFIMGDGTRMGNGLILCTHNYSIQDVVRLMNFVLMIKYRLICTLRMNKGKPTIYIS